MIHCKPFTQGDFTGYHGVDEEKEREAKLLFRQEGMFIELCSYTGDSAADLGEMLLRSALSYGANRNAFVARAALDFPLAHILRNLGFREQEATLQAEIPDVLLGGCRK